MLPTILARLHRKITDCTLNMEVYTEHIHILQQNIDYRERWYNEQIDSIDELYTESKRKIRSDRERITTKRKEEQRRLHDEHEINVDTLQKAALQEIERVKASLQEKGMSHVQHYKEEIEQQIQTYQTTAEIARRTYQTDADHQLTLHRAATERATTATMQSIQSETENRITDLIRRVNMEVAQRNQEADIYFQSVQKQLYSKQEEIETRKRELATTTAELEAYLASDSYKEQVRQNLKNQDIIATQTATKDRHQKLLLEMESIDKESQQYRTVMIPDARAKLDQMKKDETSKLIDSIHEKNKWLDERVTTDMQFQMWEKLMQDTKNQVTEKESRKNMIEAKNLQMLAFSRYCARPTARTMDHCLALIAVKPADFKQWKAKGPSEIKKKLGVKLHPDKNGNTLISNAAFQTYNDEKWLKNLGTYGKI